MCINPRPGQHLSRIRNARDFSQGQLADAIGVAIGTIQNYEHGRCAMTADRIMQLCNALQCEAGDLLPLNCAHNPHSAILAYQAKWSAPRLLIGDRVNAPLELVRALQETTWRLQHENDLFALRQVMVQRDDLRSRLDRFFGLPSMQLALAPTIIRAISLRQ